MTNLLLLLFPNRGNRSKVYNFSGQYLPSGVSVTGSSLASGYGSDGNIAWPAHNLISPTDSTNWGGWTGANSAIRSGNTITLQTSTSSNYSKATTNGVATLNSGDKLLARSKVIAADGGSVGKTVRMVSANSTSVFSAATNTDFVLSASTTTASSIRTCAETSSDQKLGFLAKDASNIPAAFNITEMQLSRYPMSPDRYVAGTDTTSPYAPTIGELIDHFQTTGVTRGLRVRSGVDDARISVSKSGIYDVTYYWKDTDQTTILSQTVSQYASTYIQLNPPVGEHILSVKISSPISFSLNEYSSNGFVIGVSGGGAAGAGATAKAKLTGKAPKDVVLQARIRQGASVIVDWHDIGTTTAKTFSFKVNNIPRGEGYTAEVRIKTIPSVVLTMTNTFHCRDLILATGSSNTENAFLNDGGQAVTDFIAEFKLYNGNNPVSVIGVCKGSAVILGNDASASNTFFYVPGGVGNLSAITTWEDFGNCIHGSSLYTLLDERGGEITAMIDGSGGNDLNWTLDSEKNRVYKLAQARKFKYAESLCGRSIPFAQQELGVKIYGTLYSEQVQNAVRQNQYDMLSEYSNIIRGGVMWDQHLANDDYQHLLHYSTLWIRHCKSIVTALGYTSSVVTRGPYVSSASRTDNTHIVVNVTLRSGTTITPASAQTGWNVYNNGTYISTTNAIVGTPSGGIVPITLTLASPITGSAQLYHRFGNGILALGVPSGSSTTTMNAAIDKLPRDDVESLPIEWIPNTGLEIT